MKKIAIKFIKWFTTKFIGIPYVEFPISFHTVDIFAYVKKDEEIFVLLGKKYNSDKLRLPGGFMDPGETSNQAAQREFKEEACILAPIENFKYIGSFTSNDERFSKSVHKITTSLFMVELNIDVIPRAGDDLETVHFMKASELSQYMLKNTAPFVHNHVSLIKAGLNNLR